MKRTLLVLAIYALLAFAATHPLWQHLDDVVPGDVGDPVLNTYILGWDARALIGDPLHVFDAGIYYPLHNTLAYSENLLGSALLALPIALLTGEPLVAYNFTFLFSFVLAGFGMYVLVLRLTRRRDAAFVAGVAFAFAPYRLASLAHIQLTTVQWLPFIADGLWQLGDSRRGTTDDGRQRSGALARTTGSIRVCIFVWLQVASSLHGAAFALLIILVFVVVHLAHAIYESRI
ncbi:MAG: hypothetical protein LC737_08055, partial [Chloroflexi bacterium]|nr:hypothetical protein [Chloroflexota bacterium]